MTDGLGLENVYGATIERMKAQGGDKSRPGMGALMWISYAERPLRADELCHALAIELGSTDFNAGNIPSIVTLVSCCQGLISVDKDAFRPRVRLIHFTLREYLSAHPDIFSRPHSAMAEICLTYLNFQQVKALPADPFAKSYLQAHVFLCSNPFPSYCSLYWGVHAKRELSNCARALALELFREYDVHISRKLLLEGEPEGWGAKGFNPSSPFNGLHCASLFGIVEIVSALIEMKNYDLNRRDFEGYIPLSWAAQKGHEEVVRLLLGREEVDPSKPEVYGKTPLSLSADAGHEGVVKILLRREEVNPGELNIWGETPLLRAAARGYEGVVKTLLGREEVNPDKPENDGRTPLSYAAFDGREGMAKILLG